MKLFRFYFFLFALITALKGFASEEKDNQNHHLTQPFIFVSCSGKTGGHTLKTSFEALGLEVLHVHSLNHDHYGFIIEQSKNRPILFIDSTREMISRKIASYFQNLESHLKMSSSHILEKYEQEREQFIDYLIQDFNKKILFIDRYHTFYWWKLFGYDVLKGSFDFEKKYQFKQIGNLYFINLRLEDVSNWKEIILSIGLPFDLSRFEILPENQAKYKYLKNIYSDFLERVTFSQLDFDKIYDMHQNEMSHFYTESEIENFINKWKSHVH
jgi:hypothetical protein